jgi:hypothetical protein
MYTVTAHNPLFVEGEQHSVDAYANHTFTALSNYKSWDEVAKWYWDIASPTIVPNDSITQIVKEVLKSNKNATQYQKAQLLYSWLEKNINYSSQSFRQDNYVPQMPNKVVEDKLGDCKDVAALYLLMCREAGIKGNFVLVNMETYASIYSKFPNNGFNHCIAKIYPDGKPIYVELTSKYLPFGHNTHYAGYAYGLEIDTAKQCNIAPVYNANKGDCMDLVSEIKVDNGNVLIHEKVATIGVTSAMVKDAFEKADSTQINTALQKLISNFMPNSKVNSCSYNVNDVNNDSIVLNYNLGNNDLYIDVAELQIYKVPTYLSKIVEESIFANNTRKTDLSFTLLAGLQSMADNHITIDIPSGKSLYKTPTDIKMNNKYFDFEVTYTVSKEALKINKHFLIKQEVISTNEFADFKTEMEKAFKADVLTVVMQ